MSTNWFKDMQDMHKKYGVDEWMNKEKNSEWCKLRTFMDFRISMMQKQLLKIKIQKKLLMVL